MENNSINQVLLISSPINGQIVGIKLLNNDIIIRFASRSPSFPAASIHIKLHIYRYRPHTIMSSSFLANAPGLGVNYSLYAIPVGWVVSLVPHA